MATLALRNKHDQAVGSLAVQLLGSTSPADIATVGGVSHDLEPKLPASIPPAVRNVVKEFSDDVLDSLKQIVVKANIVANLVGETAEVRVAPFRDVSRPCKCLSNSLAITQTLLGGSWNRHFRYTLHFRVTLYLH